MVTLMPTDTLEEKFEEIRQAFRKLKPATIAIGHKTWKLQEIKNQLYYVLDKDKIEIDVVAELKLGKVEGIKILEEYRKLKNSQI